MATNREGATFRIIAILTIGLVSIGSIGAVWADEPAAPGTPEPPRRGANPPRAKAVVTDQFNEPIEPLKPVKTASAQDKKREEALSYFMSGRLKQAETRFTEALSDYQAAIKIDPTAVEVYRAMVPLAFALNDTENGLKYGEMAIKLDPQNLEILRIMAEHLQEQHELDKATAYLDRATKSPKLAKDSATYVLLHLQLAALYVELTRGEGNNADKPGFLNKAAEAYAVVLDARRNPTKYNLDFQTRAALDREKLARFELMGEIFLLSENRARLAVQAFEEAVKARNGRPGPIHFSLALAYFKDKNYEAALKQLQIYLDAQLQGKGRDPYELLAEILKKTGKGGELISRIEELAKNDVRNSTLQFFLAEQYIAAGRTKEGEELIKRIIKETGDSEGYVGLAEIYRKQGNAENLLDALSKSLKGVKERKAQLRLDHLLGEIQKDRTLVDKLIATARKLETSEKKKLDFFTAYVVGRLAVGADQFDAAVEFYTQAMDARPEMQARLGFELGSEHLMPAKRYLQAAVILKKAVNGAMPPNESNAEVVKVELLSWLTRAQELAGKTQDSLASIHEAQKIAADEPKLLPRLQYWEAWVYSHSHQWDEAIRRLRDLIAKQPTDKEKRGNDKERAGFLHLCQYTLSNCYVQKGDITTGEKILETVLAEEPKDPSVNNDLGYLYADQGKNLDRAEKMIKIALDSEPDNIAYVDSMGWILFKLGRLDESRTYLERAVKSPSGSDATIWDHLGDCYSRLKIHDKAAEAWKKALTDAKQEPFPDKKLIESLQAKLKPGAGEVNKK